MYDFTPPRTSTIPSRPNSRVHTFSLERTDSTIAFHNERAWRAPSGGRRHCSRVQLSICALSLDINASAPVTTLQTVFGSSLALARSSLDTSVGPISQSCERYGPRPRLRHLAHHSSVRPQAPKPRDAQVARLFTRITLALTFCKALTTHRGGRQVHLSLSSQRQPVIL